MKFVDLLLFRRPIGLIRPSRAAVRLAGSRRHLNDYVSIKQPGEKESASFRLPEPQLTMVFQVIEHFAGEDEVLPGGADRKANHAANVLSSSAFAHWRSKRKPPSERSLTSFDQVLDHLPPTWLR